MPHTHTVVISVFFFFTIKHMFSCYIRVILLLGAISFFFFFNWVVYTPSLASWRYLVAFYGSGILRSDFPGA